MRVYTPARHSQIRGYRDMAARTSIGSAGECRLRHSLCARAGLPVRMFYRREFSQRLELLLSQVIAL